MPTMAFPEKAGARIMVLEGAEAVVLRAFERARMLRQEQRSVEHA
jgi:hypothetical protein